MIYDLTLPDDGTVPGMPEADESGLDSPSPGSGSGSGQTEDETDPQDESDEQEVTLQGPTHATEEQTIAGHEANVANVRAHAAAHILAGMQLQQAFNVVAQTPVSTNQLSPAQQTILHLIANLSAASQTAALQHGANQTAIARNIGPLSQPFAQAQNAAPHTNFFPQGQNAAANPIFFPQAQNATANPVPVTGIHNSFHPIAFNPAQNAAPNTFAQAPIANAHPPFNPTAPIINAFNPLPMPSQNPANNPAYMQHINNIIAAGWHYVNLMGLNQTPVPPPAPGPVVVNPHVAPVANMQTAAPTTTNLQALFQVAMAAPNPPPFVPLANLGVTSIPHGMPSLYTRLLCRETQSLPFSGREPNLVIPIPSSQINSTAPFNGHTPPVASASYFNGRDQMSWLAYFVDPSVPAVPSTNPSGPVIPPTVVNLFHRLQSSWIHSFDEEDSIEQPLIRYMQLDNFKIINMATWRPSPLYYASPRIWSQSAYMFKTSRFVIDMSFAYPFLIDYDDPDFPGLCECNSCRSLEIFDLDNGANDWLRYPESPEARGLYQRIELRHMRFLVPAHPAYIYDLDMHDDTGVNVRTVAYPLPNDSSDRLTHPTHVHTIALTLRALLRDMIDLRDGHGFTRREIRMVIIYLNSCFLEGADHLRNSSCSCGAHV